MRNYLNKENKRKLLSNFFSLSVLQGANYILPLITFPYLVRILGVENFGLLAFATATIAYFQIITDYGFNLTATREISIHRDNKVKLTEIFSSVLVIKVSLLVLSTILLSILVFSFDKFAKDWSVYFLTFGMVIGQVLFPVWFFQGMEVMKYITYLSILAKSFFTVAIFVFVQEQSDFNLVPVLNSIGHILVGIWSLAIVKKKFGINFEFQRMETIMHHLKEGWYIFISNIAISIYTVSPTFILGLITNNIIVGYFDAIQKLINAVKSLIGVVFHSIYPHYSSLINQSREQAISFSKSLTYFSSIFCLILGFIFLFYSNSVIIFVFGHNFSESNIILKIFAFIPFITSFSILYGSLNLLSANFQKQYFNILSSAGFLNILVAFVLTPTYQHIGLSISILLTETYISLLMLFFLYIKGKKRCN
jgi:PST family polysaccharide transporter